MLHDMKLTKDDCPTTDEDKDAMRAYPFRSAISSLMFAMVAMRADLSFVVTCIARFSANPGLPHWNALVRVYQYVKGTMDLKLTYSRMAPLHFYIMVTPTRTGEPQTSMSAGPVSATVSSSPVLLSSG